MERHRACDARQSARNAAILQCSRQACTCLGVHDNALAQPPSPTRRAPNAPTPPTARTYFGPRTLAHVQFPALLARGAH
eukprot:4579279-Pleurochrysis_carterae.AAC.1